MSNVRSEPLKDSQPASQSRAQPRETAQRAARGLLALLFGVPLWLAGARYTEDGWIIGINRFLGWLNGPPDVRLGTPRWEIYLTVMIGLGLAYSIVERHWPVRRAGSRLVVVSFIVFVLWAIVSVTDAGSTYLGVTAPPAPGIWPITIWVAQTWPAALVWSLVLTYAPEFLILYGLKQLFGA
jgi:hypothetical protein